MYIHKLREGYALSKCFSFRDQKYCLYSIYKPTSHCTSTGESFIYTCAVPVLELLHAQDMCLWIYLQASEVTIKLLYKYKGELYSGTPLKRTPLGPGFLSVIARCP